jgi:hypothetical protein
MSFAPTFRVWRQIIFLDRGVIKAIVRTNIRGGSGLYRSVCTHSYVCTHICRRSTAVLSSWVKRNWGRCDSSCSVGSSKIKIRTSSWHKALLALCHDEVRILIFDDPAELEELQRPPREGKLSNPRGARRAGCMHGENLRNPARDHLAGAMHQFRSGQLNSTHAGEFGPCRNTCDC